MSEELIRECIKDLIPYEPGKPIEEVKRELGLEEVIKLASNENSLGPSPKAIEAIRENAPFVNIYPDGGGFYLRKKLAQKYGLKIENILLGNGSDEIIRMTVETFLNPGEEVIVGEPAFIIYQLASKVMEGKCIKVPLKDFTHDLKAMKERVSDRTKLVFISNPNNPTGTMVTKEEVDEFMEGLPSSLIVVFDEAYFEYIDDPQYPDTLKFVREGKNVIVLRTFSKAYGLAGLRIGYALSTPSIITGLNRVRQPFNTNALAQKAAIAALDDQEHVQKSREMVKKGKNYLYAELKRLGIRFIPSVTNFILMDMKMDGKKIFQKLLKRGVIVRPMGGYNLPTYIRVTVGKMEENEKFIQALKEVLEEVRNESSSGN